MKVTYHHFAYAGQEDEASGPQGSAEVQEPGGKRWMGFAMFTFHWQNTMWKSLR